MRYLGGCDSVGVGAGTEEGLRSEEDACCEEAVDRRSIMRDLRWRPEESMRRMSLGRR
jgi:hypothetical protein